MSLERTNSASFDNAFIMLAKRFSVNSPILSSSRSESVIMSALRHTRDLGQVFLDYGLHYPIVVKHREWLKPG